MPLVTFLLLLIFAYKEPGGLYFRGVGRKVELRDLTPSNLHCVPGISEEIDGEKESRGIREVVRLPPHSCQ